MPHRIHEHLSIHISNKTVPMEHVALWNAFRSNVIIIVIYAVCIVLAYTNCGAFDILNGINCVVLFIPF